MVKIKLRFLALLLMVCLCVGCANQSEQRSSETVPFQLSTPIESKQELAKAVLLETGIAEQYDRYLSNWLGIVVSPNSAVSPEYRTWLQTLLAQEAGWQFVEAKYVDRLEATFSGTELRELLGLAQQPLMKKLIEAEVTAYAETDEDRSRLLFEVWDRYNSGQFSPPPEVEQ